MTAFIGVHVGAGRHSGSLESKYEQLCQRASKHGVDILVKGGSAFDAVVEATMVLEDSPLTNAGFGSNLTWDGTVECDASVMDGARLTFGACGAVPGVKNPIFLAKHICDQQQIPLPLGRVPPCLLTGEGAHRYAVDHNIPTVDPSSLISENALKTYKHTRRKLNRFEEHVQKKMKRESSTLNEEHLDTVGAVCVDSVGHIAAACSSGGILLKYAGRIGQAAVQGAGCWADGTVGVVTTGCGEHLIATNLAREAVRNIHSSNCPTSALQTTFKDGFLESPLLRNIQEKLAGMLVIQACEGRGEMLYAHTTDSMCIGYMSTKHKKPKSRMSRLPEGTKQGFSVVIEGVCF